MLAGAFDAANRIVAQSRRLDSLSIEFESVDVLPECAKLSGMKKNVHAQELGRLGGIARAAKLSAEQRREIARVAGLAPKRAREKKLSAKI